MQLRRFKRRLGTLTLDQELQIENLLFSTVAKISLVAQTVMEALVENSPTKSAMFPYDVVKLWRTVGEVGQSRADYFTDEGECFANTSD